MDKSFSRIMLVVFMAAFAIGMKIHQMNGFERTGSDDKHPRIQRSIPVEIVRIDGDEEEDYEVTTKEEFLDIYGGVTLNLPFIRSVKKLDGRNLFVIQFTEDFSDPYRQRPIIVKGDTLGFLGRDKLNTSRVWQDQLDKDNLHNEPISAVINGRFYLLATHPQIIGSQIYFVEKDGQFLKKPLKSIRFLSKGEKRQLEVKIALIADHTYFESFMPMERRCLSDEEMQKNAAIRAKTHLLKLVGEVSKVYERMELVNVTIAVRPIMTIIAEDSSELPFIGESKINSFTIDADTAAMKAFNWMFNAEKQIQIPEYYLTVVVTRHKISQAGKNVHGFAYPGTICRAEGIVLIHYEDYFTSVKALAQRIAVSIGMALDGNNSCKAEDNFVMSENFLDYSKEGNFLNFSTCSLKDFVATLERLDRRKEPICLDKSEDFDDYEVDPDLELLPGQIHDVDEQCQLRFGAQSFYCGNDSRITAANQEGMCQVIKCLKGKECITFPERWAMDGTTCGFRGSCLKGKCKDDQNIDKTEQIINLSLHEKTAEQSNFQRGHEAQMAIDGNDETWWQTSPDSRNAIGWWRVNLGENYKVVGLTLTSPSSLCDAYQLQHFEIVVVTEAGEEIHCATYTYKPFEPRVSKYLPCKSVVQGSLCLIRKLPGSYRQDAMALAEVQVHVVETEVKTSTTTSTPSTTTTIRTLPTTTSTAISTPSATSPPKQGSLGRATQIGSLDYHIADFAIDGDESTCAQACHPCNGTTEYGYGWWQYDFGELKAIEEVHLLTCSDQCNANTLQDTIIGVSVFNTTTQSDLHICHITFDSYVKPGQWTIFPCIEWFASYAPVGRYLTIIRRVIATNQPDKISIAEIKIKILHRGFLDMTHNKKGAMVDAEILEDKVEKGEWYKVDLSNLKTSQIGTWEGHKSDFAVDGNLQTYSVACQPCKPQQGVGWWRVDFGRNHNVAAVKITSSTKDYDSNYLQEFIIEINKDNIPQQCIEYVNRTFVPPSTSISLICDKPLEGNGLTVIRRSESSFRTDAIALAEISIYALRGEQ